MLSKLHLDEQVSNAKSYLLSSTNKKSDNAYDKLGNLIETLLSSRPDNAVDIIETQLNQRKKRRNKITNSQLEQQTAMHTMHIQMFDKGFDDEGEQTEQEEDFEIPLPNCMQLAYFFEQGGIGLAREETYRIFLACKQLAVKHRLQNVRFWGKMMGIQANYIIAEVEFRDGIEEETLQQLENEKEEDEENEQDDNEGPQEYDDLPKSQWKAPPHIPQEKYPLGTNKKAYFVCNQPGEDWVKLPHVTPEQICVSRKIKKLLTGKLDAPIASYPLFPGVESNYLRALIARITASTTISPAGYFTFDDDEDFEDEEEVRENFMVNTDFHGVPLKQLKNDNMSHWVHHIQNILQQGRCTWHNVSEKPKNDFDEEDFEDEFDDDVILPESGPQLLTSVSHDQLVDGYLKAWSTRYSSKRIKNHAFVIARSNLWPGAYSFAKGKLFDNIYIGWGDKYSSKCYTVEAPRVCFHEFVKGIEIIEVDDPSIELENTFKELEAAANKATVEIDQADENEDED